MAIERREQQAGTADDPDIIPMGNEVEVIPDPSREDQIREAAQILVLEEPHYSYSIMVVYPIIPNGNCISQITRIMNSSTQNHTQKWLEPSIIM